MSDTSYVVLTVASVDFSYRETMTKLMSSYSKDLIANAGARGTRFGQLQQENMLAVLFLFNSMITWMVTKKL